MPYRAGSAFIAVSPSFKGFQTKAAAEVRKMRPIKIPVEYDVKPMVGRPMKPVRVPAVLDVGGSFERQIRRKLSEALAALPEAEIGVATTAAEQKIKDLRAEMMTLASQRIGVDISDQEALAKIRRIKLELDRVGVSSPSIQVRADVGAAVAELAAVQEMANRIDGDKINANVDVDTGAATTKLAALQGMLAGLSGGRFLINVGIVAAPMLAPLLGVAAGGLGGVAAIGAGVGAGVIGGAALGISSIKHAQDVQKKATQGAKTVATARQGVASARRGVASAQRSAAGTRAGSGRAVASAEQGVADARRNAARANASAEQQLADARRNAARSVASAEQTLTDAHTRVLAAEKNLHAARVQEKRDLEDLRARIISNANAVKSAQLDATDAQANLANVESNIFSTSEDIAKARLTAAEAEQKLADARRQSKRDSQDLAKAEKNGTPGMQRAQDQLAAAKKEQARARQQLNQARADAARSVSRAEKNLAQTRVDSARSVARAEQNLAQARTDAARNNAAADARVADTQARLAVAQKKLNQADAAQLKLTQQLSPAQKKALAALALLKKRWWDFHKSIDPAVLGAMDAGMRAVTKTFRPLAIFIKPVAGALGDVFRMFGRMASSKAVARFSRQMGIFSGSVIRDAGRGTRNLIRAFSNLLRAFMPLGGSMSKGLVKLTRRFADWTSTLGKSKGFHQFIAFVRKNGPLVGHTLGSLGKALIAVGKAVAPLGVALLRGLKAFADWLAKTSEAHPTLIRVAASVAVFIAGVKLIAGPLAAVVGGIGKFIDVASAAWRVIKIVKFNLQILFMVMRLSPVGMIVTAIGLLVIGFVLAYKKVKWFRDGVNAALGWVKKTAFAVFGWIKKNWPLLLAILAGPFGLAVYVIVKHWDAIKKAGAAVFDWVKKNWPLLLAILTGPFGLATLFIVKHWDTIKESAQKAALWVVDKMAWMAEKVVGVLAKLPGKLGDPFRSALQQVKDFRAGVNRELDAIRDEKVNISLSTITLQHAQNKVSHQLNDGNRAGPGTSAGGGGPLLHTHARTPRAAIGGGGIFPQIKAPLGPVHKAAMGIQGDAHQLAMTEAEALQARLRKRRAARALPTDATAPAGSGPFIRPLRNYQVTATWMSYPGHTGIDLAAPMGTPVFSAGAGRVIASYDLPGSNPYNSTPYRSYGRVVEIAHPGGFSTLYAHLSQRLARVGQTVARGSLIGAVGMNGNATGPHLHFETRPGGHPVNPVPFMAARGLTFDKGGQLPQGLTVAYHGPRTPDKVLTDGQFQDLHKLATQGGGQAAQINLYDADNQLIGRMRGIARGAVGGQRTLDTTHRHAGQGVS